MQSTNWSRGLDIEVRGNDVISHTGSVITRILADRTGLTSAARLKLLDGCVRLRSGMRAAPLALPDDDRVELARWVRSTTTKAGLVLRAKIVLCASDGVAHAEIARRLSISRQTVVTWRGRYEADGIEGCGGRR